MSSVVEEMYSLLNEYNLKEITTRVDEYMHGVEVTFRSKDNKCARRLFPIDIIESKPNAICLNQLLRNMGEEVNKDGNNTK